jgi:hypothetical protein
MQKFKAEHEPSDLGDVIQMALFVAGVAIGLWAAWGRVGGWLPASGLALAATFVASAAFELGRSRGIRMARGEVDGDGEPVPDVAPVTHD